MLRHLTWGIRARRFSADMLNLPPKSAVVCFDSYRNVPGAILERAAPVVEAAFWKMSTPWTCCCVQHACSSIIVHATVIAMHSDGRRCNVSLKKTDARIMLLLVCVYPC